MAFAVILFYLEHIAARIYFIQRWVVDCFARKINFTSREANSGC